MQATATHSNTISATLTEQATRSQRAIEAIEAYLRREPLGLANPIQHLPVATGFWHKLLAFLRHYQQLYS